MGQRAVGDVDDLLRLPRKREIVRDQNERGADLTVYGQQHIHDLDLGLLVEIGSGFVGQQDRGIVDQRTGDRGAALLAGAEPFFIDTRAEDGFLPDLDAVPASVWDRCQLLYLCNPGNPSGALAFGRIRQALLAPGRRNNAFLALITFGNVLARYFTSQSFAATEEFSIALLIVLSFLIVAAMQKLLGLNRAFIGGGT